MPEYTAYIKNLSCTKTLWVGVFESEIKAERALIAKYRELGFDPNDPNCCSSIDRTDTEDDNV